MSAPFEKDAAPVPRAWQKEAADQCVSLARSGADRALIYACPGSGKTLAALFTAALLRDRVKLGPKILVLTPNLAIKTQWIDRAAALGLTLRPVTDARQLLNGDLGFDQLGFIMNYQQAIRCPVFLRTYCETHKPIVILDEVHHSAGPRGDREGNRWGATVEHACMPASFKLCTTGTPFREGNQPISFVHYNELGEATATYRYTYEQAIRQGICRPIEFELFDGEIEWRDRGDPVAANFQTKLNKRRQRQRLRAALSLDGKFPSRMLVAANERLAQIRAGGTGADARAAGLVVAVDIDHANSIAADLDKICGVAPLVVHSKIDDSVEEIGRFRDGDAPWIVGVDMISEGVDIPRLRVGVYASNVRAALYFHQFCGRLARVMESHRERSFAFLPADQDLENIALEIEKEKYHALGEDGEFLPRAGVGGARSLRRGLCVEDSDGQAEAKVISGHRISIDLVRRNREKITDMRRRNPTFQPMTDGEIVAIMLDLGAIAAEPEAA